MNFVTFSRNVTAVDKEGVCDGVFKEPTVLVLFSVLKEVIMCII